MTKLSVSRPRVVDPPTPEKITRSRGQGYRDGKAGLTIYFPDAAFTALHDAQMQLRLERRQRVSKSDILNEAMDDWFEKNGMPRHFGTPSK